LRMAELSNLYGSFEPRVHWLARVAIDRLKELNRTCVGRNL
jgi:hypothetical protein